MLAARAAVLSVLGADEMRFDCFKKAPNRGVYESSDAIALPYDDRKRSRGKGVSEKELPWPGSLSEEIFFEEVTF